MLVPGPVGETPTGATGTVALPVSIESFRLKVSPYDPIRCRDDGNIPVVTARLSADI